jgi:hypothetical protein
MIDFQVIILFAPIKVLVPILCNFSLIGIMSGLLGQLKPELPLLMLSLLCHVLQFVDQHIQIWRLFFIIFMASGKAVFFIIANDIAGLLISKEKSVREEYLAASHHFFIWILLRFRYQLVHQHIKWHIVFSDVELLTLDFFSLKSCAIFDLCLASGTASIFYNRLLSFIIGVFVNQYRGTHILVLVLSAIAAFEKRSTFNIAKKFFLLYFVLQGAFFILIFHGFSTLLLTLGFLRFRHIC